MNIFLHKQVTSDSRRKKIIKINLLRIERISLVILVWLGALGLIYGLYHAVCVKGIFRIKKVEVESSFKNFSKEDIINASGVAVDGNLYSVDLAAVQKNILKNEWVKEVSVSRKLPSTLWIYAGEFEPVALISMNGLYLVDAEGNIFKELSSGDDRNLPVITGVETEDEIAGSIEMLNTYMRSRVSNFFVPSEVHFDKIKGYSFVLAHMGVVVRVGFDKVFDKLERFYSLMGTISSYKEKMRYVDLNVPGKVVVKYES